MNLMLGDCFDNLKKIEDSSVDAVVTDPPYHLEGQMKRWGKPGSALPKGDLFKRQVRGFVGEQWDGGDISFNKELWKECLRVLKPGGHLLVFSIPKCSHKVAVALEDAGAEIRDQIVWCYATGLLKSYDIGQRIEQRQGSLNFEKSEWNGWKFSLKPAHESIVLARKELSEKTIVDNVLKHKNGALNIGGCSFGDEKIRLPSNVCHDGSNEVLDEFSINTKSSAARFFFCAKASLAEKEAGLEKPEGEERANIHPTVKPIELMRWLCRLITPKNGTVLDPFMGSGTTAIGAYREGFDFIGIERKKEYFSLAERRIKYFTSLKNF